MIQPHSEAATHGPGSTINHLLRHKSGDVDTDSITDNHKIKENNRLGGDSIIRGTDSVGKDVPKPAPEVPNYGQATNRGNLASDPWFVTDEQGKYYRNQFSSMQKNLDGKIDGKEEAGKILFCSVVFMLCSKFCGCSGITNSPICN